MNVLHKISASIVAAGLLVFSPIQTPGIGAGVKTAEAQNISARSGSRSGAYLSRVRRSGVSPSYSFQRSNLGRSINRAGVYRNVKPGGYHHHRNRYDGKNVTNSGDQLLIERRRQIEKRNARVAREFRLKNRKGQAVNQPIFVDPYYNGNGSGFVDIIGGDSAGVAIYRGQPCPTRHNCGYRLYSDGTGPRIITPGQVPSKDLPEFDGLNGPQVITLD